MTKQELLAGGLEKVSQAAKRLASTATRSITGFSKASALHPHQRRLSHPKPCR